jgi:hypothetical protein
MLDVGSVVGRENYRETIYMEPAYLQILESRGGARKHNQHG